MSSVPITILALALTVADGAQRRQSPPDADEVEAATREAEQLAKKLDWHVGQLVASLRSNDTEVRAKALETLTKLGPRALHPDLSTILIDMVRGERDPKARAQAIWLLRHSHYSDSLEAVLVALAAKDEEVRVAAVRWLSNYRPRPDLVIPVLTKLLPTLPPGKKVGTGPSFRDFVFSALIDYGPMATEADPLFVSLLKAPDPEDRRGAFIALLCIRKDKSTLVPLFKERFAGDDFDDPQRWTALDLVDRLGPLAEGLVPEIVRCVKYSLSLKDIRKRQERLARCLNKLEQLGPVAKTTAPDLLKLFFDRSLHYADRSHLLAVYAHLGSPDKEALQRIAEEVVQRDLMFNQPSQLRVAVKRLSPALMPYLAEEWKQRITDYEFAHRIMILAEEAKVGAEPLIPIMESFFYDPSSRFVSLDARLANDQARQVVKLIRAELEKQKKAVLPKK